MYKQKPNNLIIKENGDIVIHNVTLFKASLNIQYFIVNLSFDDILQSYSLITYDEQAQRRIKNGEPFVKTQQVKKFKKTLTNGDDIMGSILWNLRTEENEPKKFIYNELTRTLTISSKQKIFITDGYHRTVTVKELAEENNHDVAKFSNFPIQIHFLPKVKEKDRFGKLNHNTNQLSISKAKSVQDEARSHLIHHVINLSFFKGRVEMNEDVKTKGNICTFNQLYNAVFASKLSFGNKVDLNDKKQYDDFLSYLVEFFNILPTVRKEFNFENDEELRRFRQRNQLLDPIFLFSYTTLAKELRNESYDVRKRIVYDFLNHAYVISNTKKDWFYRRSKFWIGKILYDNGKAIIGYPPQTSMIDATVTSLEMLKNKYRSLSS